MLKKGLFKNIFQKVDQLFTGRTQADTPQAGEEQPLAATPLPPVASRRVDEELFEELEEALIGADLNIHTTLRLIEELRAAVKDERMKTAQDVQDRLKQFLTDTLLAGVGPSPMTVAPTPPTVFLVVGVNGVGKTTSIAKLASKLQKDGEKVVLAAADTFRAAAADQLQLWGERIGVEVVRGREGADPAAVVYDAMQAAKARQADFLIIDTAGRLHTKTNLMEELKKINRVVMAGRDGRPADETLLVLDATTGQNAINQAKEFKNAVAVTGLILAKLDSTARGGIVITIKDELNVPIKLVGTGEKPGDIEIFDPRDFVEALFE
ncbi:MAG: signal recognition particle-docking protein FtsY [Armatimonadota bacterium]|nr:signal recognition particle-docking protein FtsY [Armatimonadota bacterium]